MHFKDKTVLALGATGVAPVFLAKKTTMPRRFNVAGLCKPEIHYIGRSGQPPIAKRTTAEPATTPAGRTVTLLRA